MNKKSLKELGVLTKNSYKKSRSISRNGNAMTQNLFKAMGVISEGEERSPALYDVKGLTKKINNKHYRAFVWAICQEVYNQNVQSEKGVLFVCGDRIDQNGRGYNSYIAEIWVSVGELCRKGLGRNPDKEERKAMRALIETLDQTPFSVKYANGDEDDVYLAKIKRRSKRNNESLYLLSLSDIITDNMRSFTELPQDYMQRLANAVKKDKARLLEEHYSLSDYLANLPKGEEWTLTIETLLNECEMWEKYTGHRTRTEGDLIQMLKHIEQTNLISNVRTIYKTEKGRRILCKVKFYVNKREDFLAEQN